MDLVLSQLDDEKYWNIIDGNYNGLGIGGYQLLGSFEPSGGWVWVTGEKMNYTNWISGGAGSV